MVQTPLSTGPLTRASYATDRLVAAPIGPDDLGDLCRLHRDPAVMATLGGLRSAAVTRGLLATSIAHWQRHGFGLWTFRDKPSADFVARAGLRHVAIEGHDEVELAYALAARHWGRGLATELAAAIVAAASGELGLAELVATADPANAASRHVMAKVGFAFEREIEHFGDPQVLYRRRA